MRNTIISVFAIIGLLSSMLVIGGMVNVDVGGKLENNKDNRTEAVNLNYLPQQVKAIKEIHNAVFAGESIPANVDTRERLDRELTVNSYYHSSTVLNMKMANKYFPIIEPILSANGVPDDFKYLAVAESSLRNVTSPANAKGIWQMRKAAAIEMGLEVNGEVDERYHIEKATEAAAKYLSKQHRRFGSWIEAAAAYNMGPTGLNNAMKSQGTEDYFDLNINEETSRYIFRLVALKEIMSSPSDFGFYIDQEDLYKGYEETYKVTIDKSIPSWSNYAKNKGISYKILKFYNPWLRDNKLTVLKNTYEIRLPR